MTVAFDNVMYLVMDVMGWQKDVIILHADQNNFSCAAHCVKNTAKKVSVLNLLGDSVYCVSVRFVDENREVKFVASDLLVAFAAILDLVKDNNEVYDNLKADLKALHKQFEADQDMCDRLNSSILPLKVAWKRLVKKLPSGTVIYCSWENDSLVIKYNTDYSKWVVTRNDKKSFPGMSYSIKEAVSKVMPTVNTECANLFAELEKTEEYTQFMRVARDTVLSSLKTLGKDFAKQISDERKYDFAVHLCTSTIEWSTKDVKISYDAPIDKWVVSANVCHDENTENFTCENTFCIEAINSVIGALGDATGDLSEHLESLTEVFINSFSDDMNVTLERTLCEFDKLLEVCNFVGVSQKLDLLSAQSL